MKIVREFINEELVAKYYSIEIYMNPTSIKRMGAWNRAISDIKGNFFIATSSSDEYDNIDITHTGMANLLHEKGYAKDFNWMNEKHGYFENGVAWQRYKNTNIFCLSESYDIYRHPFPPEFMKKVKYWTDLIDRKDIIFKFEDIWAYDNNIKGKQPNNVEDDEFAEYDEYMKKMAKDFY